MSVMTQSQLALAQQWHAHLAGRNDEWHWQIGDWACLAREHPEESDIRLVEYVWEGLLEVRPLHASPSDPPQRERAGRFFPLPSWERGRAWLRSHGWGFPHCTTDGMTITWFFEPFQTDLDELLSTQGLTDLECLYAAMLQVTERERRLGP
ncbi:MAG: hypothetical protein HYZ81_17575 [Nitrospinae bacterium]|nr:hypothetical protein [Nitrospinota bacterium]